MCCWWELPRVASPITPELLFFGLPPCNRSLFLKAEIVRYEKVIYDSLENRIFRVVGHNPAMGIAGSVGTTFPKSGYFLYFPVRPSCSTSQGYALNSESNVLSQPTLEAGSKPPKGPHLRWIPKSHEIVKQVERRNGGRQL